MTDERPLNVRIAEAKGWTQRQLPPSGHAPGPLVWRSPDDLPGYGVTWADTGPLLEEMIRDGGRGELARALWACRGDNMCEVVAAAWLAWKKAA